MDLNGKLQRLRDHYTPASPTLKTAQTGEDLLVELLTDLVEQTQAHRSFIESIARSTSMDPTMISLRNTAKKLLRSTR